MLKIMAVAVAAFLAAETAADAQLIKSLLNKTSGNAETTTVATSNGRAAGAALKSLYAQYKADGKLDMGNLNNIMNLATLANNTKDLKGKDNKSDFYKDFATGLVLGSENLVTQAVSNSVMSGLTDLVTNVDLSGLTTAAATATAATAATKTNATNAATSALASAAGALANTAAKADTAVDNANEIASSVSDILNLFK